MTLFDNKYSFIKDLGSGGFGKVFLAKEKIFHKAESVYQVVLIKVISSKINEIIREHKKKQEEF